MMIYPTDCFLGKAVKINKQKSVLTKELFQKELFELLHLRENRQFGEDIQYNKDTILKASSVDELLSFFCGLVLSHINHKTATSDLGYLDYVKSTHKDLYRTIYNNRLL